MIGNILPINNSIFNASERKIWGNERVVAWESVNCQLCHFKCGNVSYSWIKMSLASVWCQ